MPIDPSVAVGAQLHPVEFSWTTSDVQLYHLALGVGEKPTDPAQLRLLSDTGAPVLPSFATVAAGFHETEPPSVSFPGIDIDLAKVVHGSQSVTVHGPIPSEGKARTVTRIAEVWDKGKAAVVVQESQTTTLDGAPLWTARSSIFARGEGGFGGERGPSESVEIPDRAPDAETLTPTLPQQALLYRMCGDRNPLHSDPEFAKGAGFDTPILHGLCTYGMVLRACVDALADGDPTRVTSYGARFAGIVLPGETLRTRMWSTDDGYVARTSVVERDDAPALSDVVLTLA